MTGVTAGQAAFERWKASMDLCGVGVDDWADLSEADQVSWEAVPLPEPQPAPELAEDAMRQAASRELAAAMAEARRFRDALMQVAKHDGDAIAQVRTVAKIARRALDRP